MDRPWLPGSFQGQVTSRTTVDGHKAPVRDGCLSPTEREAEPSRCSRNPAQARACLLPAASQPLQTTVGETKSSVLALELKKTASRCRGWAAVMPSLTGRGQVGGGRQGLAPFCGLGCHQADSGTRKKGSAHPAGLLKTSPPGILPFRVTSQACLGEAA